jgi:hypothetical protein
MAEVGRPFKSEKERLRELGEEMVEAMGAMNPPKAMSEAELQAFLNKVTSVVDDRSICGRSSMHGSWRMRIPFATSRLS